MDPNAGGSITFDFTVDPSTYDSATITIDGQDIGGMTWNGMLYQDGRVQVANPGTYTAELTVTKDGLSDTKDLPIHVDGYTGCPLLVTVGSSANVASGELFNHLDLFSNSGTGPSLGLSIYYGSLDGVDGFLGAGWSHSYDIFVTKNQNGDVVLHQGNGVRRLYTLSGGSYTSQPGDTSTLTKSADGTFLLTRQDGTRFAFNADGKIATITDRNGNALTFSYFAGLLQSVTDGAGRSVTFDYDANGKLATVTDPTGQVYSFGVGESLNSVQLPGGGTWSYAYDSGSFLAAKTDPDGNITHYAYDGQHRLVSATDPQGRTRTLSYPTSNDAVRTTQFTEQDGGVWQYTYDTTKGDLLKKTDPQGNVTSYTYDADHDLLTKTDASGTTTYTYDANGDVTSVTDPLGEKTTYTYNAYGQVISVTDPSGNTTSYIYDDKGNLLSLTDPTGAVTSLTYDAKGHVTSLTNPTGKTTQLSYDAAGNPTSVTDPTGATTTFTYDAAGRRTSLTDAAGQTTTFSYDSAGHLVKVTDPAGHSTTATYDASGNRVSQTDANGNATTYAYDYLGQVTQTTDANGNSTIFTYGGDAGCPSCGGDGASDKLSAVTDANGHATTFQYDTNGNLIQKTDPLGHKTLYDYDADGRLTGKTDPDGHTITYSYDADGHLVKKSYPDGTSATFSYDAQGHLLTAQNANAGYTFTYDAAGHVTSVTDGSGHKIAYAYDAAGRRILLEAPNGKDLLYQYDGAGRLASLVLDSGAFTFGYDKLGRRSSLTYPNGIVASYFYDKDGRLTTLGYQNHRGDILAKTAYTLDAVGNRLSKTSDRRTVNYSYDKIYQLLQAVHATPGFSPDHDADHGNPKRNFQQALEKQKLSYQYDPVGNRQNSTHVKSYTHDADNELLSADAIQYSYDNDGNLTQKVTPKGITTYSWDYESQLTQVTLPNGTTVRFKYDPFGRRIEKKVIGRKHVETTRYLYDGANILLTTDGDDNDHGDHDHHAELHGTFYIQGPGADEHLAFIRDGKTFYYHADGLGSVVALTDQRAKVVRTYAYDPYGNLLDPGEGHGRKEMKENAWGAWWAGKLGFGEHNEASGRGDRMDETLQPYAFTGREYDPETGLYYYRARYYDSQVGRFISKDPIAFAGGDVNLYRYVKNDPVYWVDPYGLVSSSDYASWVASGADLVSAYTALPTNPSEAVVWSASVLIDKSSILMGFAPDNNFKAESGVFLSSAGLGISIAAENPPALVGLAGYALGDAINNMPVGNGQNFEAWLSDKIWNFSHNSNNNNNGSITPDQLINSVTFNRCEFYW